MGIPTLVLQPGPRSRRGSETTRPSPSPVASAHPRSLTERREWNEWVPTSPDARGNQMIRREGLPQGSRDRRLLSQDRYNSGVSSDSAEPPSPYTACAAHSQKPGSWGRHPGSAASLPRAGGFEKGSATCDAGSSVNATRAGALSRLACSGPARAPEPLSRRECRWPRRRGSHWPFPRPVLLQELSARGAETQRRTKRKSTLSVSPKTLFQCVPEMEEEEEKDP